MTDSVIQGTVDGWRTMARDGSVRLVIDCPAYEAEKIVRLLGVPQPGESVAVAVARVVADEQP
jgi:hypothetical protein